MVSAVVGKTMPEPLKIVSGHGFIEIQKWPVVARISRNSSKQTEVIRSFYNFLDYLLGSGLGK